MSAAAVWFVVDAEAITDIDLSAANTVRHRIKELSGRGVSSCFGRVSTYLLSDLKRHRITPLIGEGRVSATLHEAIEAIARVGAQIDRAENSGTAGPISKA